MILLIDTINDKGCIGFYDGKKLHTKIIESSPANNKKIVKVIDGFVNKNLSPDNKVEAIGVVNGPGAFTGVRTGVVIANAAAYALKVPIYAVDTLTAQIPVGAGPRARPKQGAHMGAPLQNVVSLLSASNSEVYFARFNQGKMEPTRNASHNDAGGGKIEIVNVENNLKNRLNKGDYIVGDLKCEHTASLNIQSEDRIKNLLQMIINKQIKPTKQVLPLYIKKPNISKPKKK